MAQPYILVDGETGILRLERNDSEIATHKAEEMEALIATHGTSQVSDATAGFAHPIRLDLMLLVVKYISYVQAI